MTSRGVLGMTKRELIALSFRGPSCSARGNCFTAHALSFRGWSLTIRGTCCVRLHVTSIHKIRLGVVGLGRAFTLMLPTFIADERIELTGATDPREAARRRFESDFGA